MHPNPEHPDEAAGAVSMSGSIERSVLESRVHELEAIVARLQAQARSGPHDTDALRADRRLADAQHRQQRVIFDSVVDFAIVATDRAGLITDWNTGAERNLGWSAAEMLGHTANRFFTPEDRAAGRIETEMRLALRDGSASDERWHVRKGGGRFWASGEMMPLRDEDGEHLGFVKVLRDRTAEHEAGRRIRTDLRNTRDFTRLALAAVGGVGVWTYDVATDRFTCDAAVSGLYAIDPAEGAAGITRERFLANVHPDDLPSLRATMASGLARSGDLELEYRIQHPGGVTRWVMSRGHTYFDEAHRPVGRTGVAVEMSKQRQLEEQLRQSQKMEAVGQLTGGLAHDFNNLLTGITGSLELLQIRVGQGRFDTLGRYIDAAQDAARRAAALTHRLLAFSRRQTLEPRPTDANQLVLGMLELLDRTVGSAVTIVPVLAPDPWITQCDPNQLENALLNLCINARDAMPDGGRITITTANLVVDADSLPRPDMPAGQYVALSIADTGTGMPPEIVARVFDPFFTTKPAGAGTGLGLSMVYGFARQSGGEVRIRSAEGTGTTVDIILPRHLGVLPSTSAASVPKAAQLAGAGQTVLVVDDEPTVRMLVVELLRELGYRAIEAADGPSGLRLLRSTTPIDLVVTDVGLPGGMNGRQMADAARLLRPDLQVLFVTGYADSAVLAQDDADPGMHVLAKPFGMDVLAARIRQLLDRG